MRLENYIWIEKKPQNEAAGCCEGNGVALMIVLRCFSSLGVHELNSNLISWTRRDLSHL